MPFWFWLVSVLIGFGVVCFNWLCVLCWVCGYFGVGWLVGFLVCSAGGLWFGWFWVCEPGLTGWVR